MWTKRDESKTIRDVFLRNIGEDSLDNINAWFKRSYANEWRIDGLKEAVELALKFKDQQVTIVGDYDADGVTSTSILYLALTRVGFKKVNYRIPKRFSEGFGINPIIIDEIKEGLVITCDNGVAQSEAIKKAKDKGLTVIIIDHHQPAVDENGKVIIPNADIIIDPNAIEGSADYSGYCGAGLSWRFARELGNQCGIANLHQTLIGLAAIGTVADVMELRKENYVIVRNGLKHLAETGYNTVGTATLASAAVGNIITAHDVGFKIGPVINAASRMKDDGAKSAVELLTYNGDTATAIYMTERLLNLNDVRKGKKREAIAFAEKTISDECMYGDTPLIVYLPKTAEGIIGIVAGNLCEKYEVPAIVLTDSENPDILKGSARSCGNCDIKAKLDECNSMSPEPVLAGYGGHEGAAGLSVYRDKLDLFRELMATCLLDFENSESGSKEQYDLEVSVAELGSVTDELQKYEPFGEGNAPITFKVTGFNVTPVMGKYVSFIGDGTIAKINGTLADAIGFDMKDRFKTDPKKLDLLGNISVNRFNGKSRTQIEFTDFVTAPVNAVETPLACMLKDYACKS